MSRPVKELLLQGRFTAQVVGVFEHACNLVTPDGEVVALVVPDIGNGPFNIVMDDQPAFFAEIETNTPVIFARGQLQLGRLQVGLRGAAVWEPQPDWNTLRTRQTTIVSGLPFLRTACHRNAPDNTFLNLLKSPRPDDDAALAIARSAGGALRSGWAGNQDRLRAVAITLAGLGNGLTPAGDDFLAGVMLWAWLTHPDPVRFCHTLLDVAAPRTTTLSAAFLQAAAQGECSQSWHILLTTLSTGTATEIEEAVQQVLTHGATSGADTLAGFLYLTEKN